MSRFCPAVESAARIAIELTRQRFSEIERVEQVCSERILAAFEKHHVSEAHLLGTTGYGYGDLGRETLDKIYAEVYGAEDAFVRIQMVSGTHAISTALFGVLRPGDRVLCATGKPYDTIMPTVGNNSEPGCGSLADYGVKFDFIDFDGTFNTEEIIRRASGCRMVYVQRSRGYTLRRSLRSEEITALYNAVKEKLPDTVFFVDNCYGEFVCEEEPRCDIMAGSLIKNAGGGLCPCGGYIVGKTELVNRCADRLFAVGIGREVGATMGNNRQLYMGLFMAPHATAQALKTAVFAAALFGELGYDTVPLWNDERGDIVQLLRLGNAERLCAFCRGLQSGSPVDSHVTPEPWDMPGYDSKVIMAAGGFISGSSVEISADAPLREPYCVWLQGGLTFATGKYAVMRAADKLMEM